MNKNPVLGILGFGGCGVNVIRDVIETLHPDQFPFVRLLVAGTTHAEIETKLNRKTEGSFKAWKDAVRSGLRVISLGTEGFGAGADPEVAKTALLEHRDEIVTFMQDCNALLILGGLGKGTGTGSMPLAAEWAVELGKDKKHFPVFALPTFPSTAEHASQTNRAYPALVSLLENVGTVVVYNAHFEERDCSVREAHDKINRVVLHPAIRILRELVLTVGEVDIDLADLSNFWRLGGNVIGVGFAEVAEKDSPKVVVSKLLEQRLQHPDVFNHARATMLWFSGPGWFIGEINDVLMGIREQIAERSGRTDSDVSSGQLYWGVAEKDDSDGKWVGLLTASPVHAFPEFKISTSEPQEVEVSKVPPPAPAKPSKPVTMRVEGQKEGGNGDQGARPISCRFIVEGKEKELAIPAELHEKWKGLTHYRVPKRLEENMPAILAARSEIQEITGVLVDLPVPDRPSIQDEKRDGSVTQGWFGAALKRTS